ncbi:MAG: PAS domain S-box-containing protein [Gammaproteobacteria bacterium]
MAALNIRELAVIVLATLALSVLYFKTQSVDLQRHQRTEQTLREMKDWDAVLKQDVLRTRTGLLNHYDTLVSTMKALRAAHLQFADGPDALHDGTDSDLQQSIENLGKNLATRALNLERFKSRNAILKNSLSYLAIAIRRLTQSLSKKAGMSKFATDTSAVLRDTLIYNLSGDPKLRNDLQDAVVALRETARALAGEPRQEVENILAHVAVVLRNKAELDDLVANLVNAQSLAHIDEVVRRYDAAFSRLEQQANFYRLLLYALSILLLLCIAYTFVRLKRAALALSTANAELEQRVAARTTELVEMNGSLRVHLDRLSLAMERAEKGNFEARLSADSDSVYATLYTRFNRMIDGISDEAQILKVAQELSGELKLDVLLARIMRTTTELLNADRSTIFVHDRRTNELWSRVAEGVKSKEIRIPDNAGIAGKVFTTGMAENVPDPYAHELFNPEVDRNTGYKTENILCMPIIDKFGKHIGVTQVLNKIGGEFLARDEARLKAFTAQVSISLANAQLFADVTNEKKYHEATLNSLSNGVITFDTQVRISTMNPAAARILARDSQALLGNDVMTAFGGDQDWVATYVTELLRTGQADTFFDIDISLEDGRRASINLTVVPLRDEEGEAIGGMLILEDITNEKRVKSTMARYMTKEIAEQLMEVGEDALGGRSQTATVLFSDIRGFTAISENLGARSTVSMLNEYFTEMVEVIFQHKGILDKYIGDAIMAVFGTPFPTADDTDNAIIVANHMIKVLRILNARRRAAGDTPISIGVGISTGNLISGNIGSPKRMDYTVIGDSVNLAARLESATKYYGVAVLASESTLIASNGQHQFRELDLIVVKGKTKPVAVYEALDHHDDTTFVNMSATLAAFEQGLAHYRQRDFASAHAKFERARDLRPDDGPSILYLQRCAHYRDTPPPQDWAGVWEMTSK